MSSWLLDYFDYTAEQESPQLFHMWAGMTVIAAVLGRSVFVERKSSGIVRYKVYPGQLMTVLVAESGLARKGAAVRIGRDMMKRAGVQIIKGKGSTEGILDRFAEIGSRQQKAPPGAIRAGVGAAVATIVAPELSVLLSKQTYADSLIDLLTDLYDAEDPFEFATRKHPIVLRNPCITMLAAATPISLGESLPEKTHAAGWPSRVVHVYHPGDPSRMHALADTDDDVNEEKIRQMKILEQSLVDRLLTYRKLRGPFRYTKDGQSWFRAWYKKYHMSPEGQREGWPARRADHLLRVAAILRVAGFGDLVLDEASLRAADQALTAIEINFTKAFSGIGQTAITRKKEKIIAEMRRMGGRMSAPALYNRVYRFFQDINELKLALNTLREAEIIDRLVDGRTQVEWWILREAHSDAPPSP